MNLEAILSERISIHTIDIICQAVQKDKQLRQNLYDLAINRNGKISYQALWVLTHMPTLNNDWLCSKQNELIDRVLNCEHGGKRRLLLTLIHKQAHNLCLRVDFLNFCFEKMVSAQELPGVRSVCMKIAYQLCICVPELMTELETTIDLMKIDPSPAMQAVRKNTLKAIKKRNNIRNCT